MARLARVVVKTRSALRTQGGISPEEYQLSPRIYARDALGFPAGDYLDVLQGK